MISAAQPAPRPAPVSQTPPEPHQQCGQQCIATHACNGKVLPLGDVRLYPHQSNRMGASPKCKGVNGSRLKPTAAQNPGYAQRSSQSSGHHRQRGQVNIRTTFPHQTKGDRHGSGFGQERGNGIRTDTQPECQQHGANHGAQACSQQPHQPRSGLTEQRATRSVQWDGHGDDRQVHQVMQARHLRQEGLCAQWQQRDGSEQQGRATDQGQCQHMPARPGKPLPSHAITSHHEHVQQHELNHAQPPPTCAEPTTPEPQHKQQISKSPPRNSAQKTTTPNGPVGKRQRLRTARASRTAADGTAAIWLASATPEAHPSKSRVSKPATQNRQHCLASPSPSPPPAPHPSAQRPPRQPFPVRRRQNLSCPPVSNDQHNAYRISPADKPWDQPHHLIRSLIDKTATYQPGATWTSLGHVTRHTPNPCGPCSQPHPGSQWGRSAAADGPLGPVPTWGAGVAGRPR